MVVLTNDNYDDDADDVLLTLIACCGVVWQTNLRVVRVGTIKYEHEIGEKDKVSTSTT